MQITYTGLRKRGSTGCGLAGRPLANAVLSRGASGIAGGFSPWPHAFSTELNYCFNGIRIDAQRKMRLSICHLMLYAVASRRPLPCSPAWIIRPYAGRYHYLLVLLSDVGTIACAA